MKLRADTWVRPYDSKRDMARFFNFYDPLEKRYVFNSFLVIVALVEVLILFFTVIWKIDLQGIFADQARTPVPFPWKPYLLASFAAPIALLFLFGLIIQGFEILCQSPGETPPSAIGLGGRRRPLWYLLGLLAFMACLASLTFLGWGKEVVALIAGGIKGMGLGGSYLLIALVALALLYLPLRLVLRYRLEKKAMEYQYLLYLAQRHGVLVIDPKDHPELATGLEGEKNLTAPSPSASLPSPDSPQDHELP
ncbi:MAG: hypothetical protein WBW55_00860 [Desulfobaccales bacterium]